MKKIWSYHEDKFLVIVTSKGYPGEWADERTQWSFFILDDSAKT